MKYLALALALLLAVGSHAAPHHPHSPVAPIEAVIDIARTRVKNGLDNTFTGTEYEVPRNYLTGMIDSVFDRITSVQQNVVVFSGAFVRTVMDATADMRATIREDIDSLKTNTEPKLGELKNVLKKLVVDCKDAISSQIEDSELNNLKDKFKSIMDLLKSKFTVHAEGAKSVALPIIDAIADKVVERTGQAKQAVAPYVEDLRRSVDGYRQKMLNKARDISVDDWTVFQEKVSIPAEDIRIKLREIVGIISETFSEN